MTDMNITPIHTYDQDTQEPRIIPIHDEGWDAFHRLEKRTNQWARVRHIGTGEVFEVRPAACSLDCFCAAESRPAEPLDSPYILTGRYGLECEHGFGREAGCGDCDPLGEVDDGQDH
jgi:hypothetical protein